jgi:hypothetical protein
MSEPTFQIVFRGKILGGFQREQVRSNLAQLFKTTPERIDALLDAPKTVLKAGLSRDAAARYQDMLRQAGIMVAVVSDAPIAAAATPAAASSATAPTAPSPAVVPATRVEQPLPSTPSTQTVAALTLAPAGTTLLPPQTRVQADIDTSRLSLAQPGVTLGERRPAAAPAVDISGISLANDDGPIDPKPKAPPADIDTSALSLAERPPEIEEAPSELQKLLSASID